MTDDVLDYCGGVFGAASASLAGQAQRPFALPGDQPHYARDRLVDVRHIKLEIRIDPQAQRIEGTASTTFTPINDGLRHVEYDAVEMEISDVRIEGRRNKPAYTYDGAHLRIELGAARRAGEELTTVVSYAASPRRGLYFVEPDEAYPDKPVHVWSQGQDEDSRHWFPCFDFPNELATSEVLVTVPKPMTAVSNGRLVRVRDLGEERSFHWRQTVPHVAYLLSVAAGDFDEIKGKVDGTPLQYYVAKGRSAEGRRALGRTPDIIRFYLCANAPESKDADFDWDDFMQRYNSELCNVVGNFVHRTLTMVVKNCDSKVPEPGEFDDGDRAALEEIPKQVDSIAEALEAFRFRQAIERFVDLGRKANVYFDGKEPWVTRKTDPARTATTLHICCQYVKALCHTMAPFLPGGAQTLSEILGVTLPRGGPEGGQDGWNAAKDPLTPGSPIAKPKVLFPKLDEDRIAQLAEAHLRGEAF